MLSRDFNARALCACCAKRHIYNSRRLNPVALITGGSRGIGRGIALKLAEAGYDTVINYAGNQTAAQQTAAACRALGLQNDCHVQADIFKADISVTSDRQKLIEYVKSRFNRLDLLVNNACIEPEIREDMLG